MAEMAVERVSELAICWPSVEALLEAADEMSVAFHWLNSDYTIERFERNGIKSALIYFGRTRPKEFKVLLNGHLDVVPGKKEAYTPKIKGNRLYGVGAMDMKANVACQTQCGPIDCRLFISAAFALFHVPVTF